MYNSLIFSLDNYFLISFHLDEKIIQIVLDNDIL